MKKWLMIIDVEKCENCNNRFLACKDEHVGNSWQGYAAPQPEHGHKWMNVHSRERGEYPLIDVAYLPQPCMHCDNAPCIKAAKDNAVYKRPDGIVIIDPVKAKGQHQLIDACPYHAIWWNGEIQIAQKCTLCAHLLDDGWTKPRCVQSCPTGALSVRGIDDKEIQKAISAEKLEPYLPQYRTNPRILYKNLYRYTRCFIAGSLAIKEDGKEECAAGARVILQDADGNKIGETVTDNFGDFNFDNLLANSGRYSIEISYQDYTVKTVQAELKTSINTGTIFLQKP